MEVKLLKKKCAYPFFSHFSIFWVVFVWFIRSTTQGQGKFLYSINVGFSFSQKKTWLALFLNFSVRRKKSGSAPLRDGGEVAKNQHAIQLSDLSLWFEIIRLKGRLSYLTEQGQLGMAR